MNYPVWDLQASGLLIAFVAIVHVYVSHFAVGGGLFLVLTEHKARRDGDTALLAYLKTHARFFILLTLVFGAITGVGIWFTITLVHPAATSSLVNTFVWGWAIEWTFFVAEIAAAMVYYYGWDRLSSRQHLAVGWIYFGAAWMSMVVINGILSYMLTPGAWVTTRGFWDGFFNETYWPSLAARTVGAAGIAGLYAVFTAAFLRDRALKARIARYAGLWWVVPAAVLLPLSLGWFFAAAQSAGVPLGEILGSTRSGAAAAIDAAWRGATASGYPAAQHAARIGSAAMLVSLLVTLFVVFVRRERYGRLSASLLLATGLVGMGGAEWMREGLRKPYVLGGFMFVNGVRLPPPSATPALPHDMQDDFTVEALNRTGVLPAARWVKLPDGYDAGALASLEPAARTAMEAAIGRQIFRVECASCHSRDRYNAIAPLVSGKSSAALEGVISRLATMQGETGWTDAALRLQTWRGRRMPPFVGTAAEARMLAVYLATVGGGAVTPPPADAAGGAQILEERCSMCHAADGDWPMAALVKGRTPDQLYDLIGRLPAVNEMMPAFEGTDAERRALAEHLVTLGHAAPGGSEDPR